MIILLPMPVFLKSQLPTRKKVMLCGIFALGTFTVGPTLRILGRIADILAMAWWCQGLP